MSQATRFSSADEGLQILWEDGGLVLSRGWRLGADGNRSAVLMVRPVTQHPAPVMLDRLAHEYGLRAELDTAWAVRPLELLRDRGQTMLLLEDPGGEPLVGLIGEPMELGRFLRLAISIAAALSKVHQRGLVHKDIKPPHVLVSQATREVKLMGFGIASRLQRERQAPGPPEFIAGTLAYMAPEQTGRMSRSIDARSDLYSLGVTFYEMLTGTLPFTASNPMEWVHCHIARRPIPPAERVKHVPAPVSTIVLKLLTKTAEERYQTAAGLERDLRRCLAEWESQGDIEDFPLGQQDTPNQLLIPEKLYGREREIETLLSALDRTVKGGAPELVLVSGYSGIGKSSVVNELHKVLVPPRGLFASGKFDQHKRDIPYATLTLAFQSLIRPLLGKSDAELAPWREALAEVLGPNGGLIVPLIPELETLLGPQPPVPELPPQDAQRRFQLVFQRFIAVFGRPERPLALFLDDLQWVDGATLDLLEGLVTQSDLQHLLLIGAYRANEVDATHPLTHKLGAIRQAGAAVHEMRLAPLGPDDVSQLIADALRCEPARAALLAEPVHEKTAGNPLFVIHFLYALVEEGLLSFDHDEARWCWDLERIQARGYTDNVVDLMVGKLARLAGKTQRALQQLACVGNAAETTMLSIVFGASHEEVHAALWEAVRQDLIERQEGTYQFVHDRVREAAYSSIPAQARAHTHLLIGRLLAAQTPTERREEAIFDIVNQLNRGAALIASPDEREQLAELNLIAGLRARASTAYASVLSYVVAGAALLPDDCWERRHQLAFSLELHRAECEFVTGAVEDAEHRLSALATRAANTTDHAAVARLRVDLYTALSQPERAVSVGLAYLRQLGVRWSAHPSDDDVRGEYEHVWSRLKSRAIEELLDRPLMTDAVAQATIDLLTALMPAAFFTDANLRSLVVLKAVDLSLEWGHSDASCVTYVMFGAIAGARFGDYQAGLRFSKLGTELVERRGLSRVQARTYLNYGNLVLSWTKHLRHARDAFRRAFEAANNSGDVTFAAFSCASLNVNLLASGDPLAEAHREAEHGLQFAEKARFALLVNIMTPQLGLIRMLRGLTLRFGTFDDGQFDELRFERHLSADPAFALPESWYWIRKLQARFFAGDFASAVEAASKARRLRWSPPQLFETAEYEFYAALSHAACWDSAPTDQREQHIEALSTHQSQLEAWAQNCPENFADRAALVGAEIARLQGRELDAERLYEQAIRSARNNGFVHHEALAYELAARFYAKLGLETNFEAHLRNARYCYLRWGAEGKVRQLDALYPHLREDEPIPRPTSTIGAPAESLDLATVIKVSQAVYGEIVLERWIDTLMRTAVEQAGAERGLLILSRGAEQRIAAEAGTSGDTINVHSHDEPISASVLPLSVLHYVLRTRESLILDDAVAQSPFAADPYICQTHARSVLCLPVLNRAKLIGVLYLENNLAPRVFAPGRTTALKLLASQAAIALENTRLYHDLAEREAKIGRLVDANIIGIVIWNLEGQILDANNAFLHMVGYDREDLASGRVHRTDLTPAEWRDRDARTVAELKMLGIVQPFENEYLRKDGSRVPVLVGFAAFDEQRDQGVAFVLDLTERKRAEEALRASEERFRTLMQFSFDVYWETDAQHRFVRQEFSERLSDAPPPGSEIGKTRWEVPYLEPDEEAWRHHRETLDAHLPFRDFEFARPTPDGGKRYVSVSGLPMFDEAGHFIGYRGVGRHITERKRIEQALSQRERELREVVETIPAMTVMTLPDGSNVFASRGWTEYTGLSRENTEGSGWQAAVHPDDLDRHVRKWRGSLASGEPFENEARFRRAADGEYRWFLARFVSLRDEGGNILRWYGILADIEDRKRAEAVLREREAQIRRLVDANIIGIFIGDFDGRFLEANGEFLRMVGYDHQDLVAGRISGSDVTPPEWRERTERAIQELKTTGTMPPYEKEYFRKDGSRVPVLVGATIFEEGGKETVGFVLDLTDRKRAEAALRESEEQWKAVFENNPVMYFMVDETGTTISVNPFGAEQLGYRSDELIGRPVHNVFHEADRAAVRRNAAICFEQLGHAMSWELRKVRKNGEVIWVRETARATLINNRPVLLIVCEDITGGKRAAEALREARMELAHANRVATMGQLTASVAHEVSQPVATVRNNASAALNFLDRNPPDLEEVREALRCIVGDTDRARDIIGRIRDQIKKAPPRKDSVDLNETIREVIALARSELAKSGVLVQERLTEGLSSVQADRVALQQVILNLILNAVEAMSSINEGPRELLISTEQSQMDGVFVAVRDSGPGIDPEHLERVFEAFYTTKSSGVGMGLSICRSIIDAHGGRLWAEANTPKGAVFRFTLPADKGFMNP